MSHLPAGLAPADDEIDLAAAGPDALAAVAKSWPLLTPGVPFVSEVVAVLEAGV